MEKEKKKKKRLFFVIGVPIILIATFGLLLWGAFGRRAKTVFGHISLNQRDIAIDVGETAELEIAETGAGVYLADAKVKWISNNPSVASVDEGGVVTGSTGGEARITAVVRDAGKEYTASCIVTVKAAELEYSSYQIQWYTQRQDRNGYEVFVETYERLVGSEVNLTKQEAKEKLPKYYVLNEDKCVLDGTVKGDRAGCILQVYYDVAEISYAVDYYYESDTALDTYQLKETKQCKAYAFSKVEAPTEIAEGFVVNEEAKGSVLTVDSVVSNSRLKVYCDRIRSEVTIKYVSGRQLATYENVYGVGLVGAPADALEENIEPYETTVYLSGKPVEDIQSAVKELTADAKVEFKISGRGFIYRNDGSLLENYYDAAQSAYVYLQGSSKTIHLSANYNLTGSQTNMSGITLRSGDENRQILFNHQGVVVLKDYVWSPGTVSDWAFEFNHSDERGYILVQNSLGYYETQVKSVISDMMANTEASNHDVVWAVWKGTLYCSVDGIVAVRLPLNQLVESWTADTKLEIGFAAYDGVKVADEIVLRDVEVRYGSAAKSMLHTDGQATKEAEIYQQAYDPLSGSYIPTSDNNSSWIYGPKTAKNSGITAEVTWMDKDNTGTLVGATVRMGDKSVQYYVRGQNRLYQTQKNHVWDECLGLDLQRINNGKLFDENGSSKIGVYVKDGYFYVTFNGVQAQCVNMLSLFPDYTTDSEVSVGISTLNASAGLAYFENIEVLNEKAVTEQQGLKQWGFYSEIVYGESVKYDFAEGTIVKDKAGWHEVDLLGGSKQWHIKGVMKRSDARDAGDLLMGIVLFSGEKAMSLYGHDRGFVYNWNFFYNAGSNKYTFGDSHGQFFNATRNKDELPFEIIIYQDILYAYLDGELSWRIPLTEEQFGFEKGSRYGVRLSMADPDRRGSIEDIEVHMGYQVTEETEFMTYKGKTYSFKKAMSKIEANVAKYQDINNVYWRGNLLEEISFTTKEGHAYLTTENDQKQGLKTTIVYKDGGTGSLYNGVILKSGEDVARIVVDSEKDVIILQLGETNATTKILSESSGACVDGKCELAVIVKDEKLFLTANGTPLGSIKLKKLLENYKKDDKVVFGICSNNAELGSVGFTDITKLTGNEEDIEYRDSNMKFSEANERFKVAYSTSGMTADRINGTVTANLTDGNVNTLCFGTDNEANSSKYWEITGNLKVIAGHVKGFTLQSADESKAGFYTMWYEGVSLNQNWGWPSYTDANPWNVYNTDGVYVHSNADYSALSGINVEKRFKAVIKDDIFSFWVEGKLVWELPLTDERFGGFEPGTSYRFALRHLDYGGQAEWSDLTVKHGQTFSVAYSTSGMTADRINGTVTANLTDGNVNTLCFGTDNEANSSKYWQITGNLKVITGHVKGFTLQSADGGTTGFYTMWYEGVSLNQNWGWPSYTDANPWNIYNTDGVYVHSNADYNALGGPNVEKRFKAVIKDDVFSFWVEDKLVWELPLTDERFGGFEPGTSYRFALRHLDYGGQAEWSDLTVKYGQAFLVADKTSGMTADCFNGMVTASGVAENTLYFGTDNATNRSEYWEITGNMSQTGEGLKLFTIQSTDGIQQKYTLYDGHLLVNADNGAYDWYSWQGFPEYVFSNSYYNAGMTISHGPLQFKAVIEDDQFKFWVEGKLVWNVPLTDSRFGGFAAGSSYQIAIGAGVNGQVQWSDLKVKY